MAYVWDEAWQMEEGEAEMAIRNRIKNLKKNNSGTNVYF